jgi:hypothetical protein
LPAPPKIVSAYLIGLQHEDVGAVAADQHVVGKAVVDEKIVVVNSPIAASLKCRKDPLSRL